MEGTTAVERDMMQVANYWRLRKYRFLEQVADEFIDVVRPVAAFRTRVRRCDVDMMNMAMTEWFLFERTYGNAGTPLERFIADPPKTARRSSLARLRQVADTHLFSRFSILGKDVRHGTATLQDTRTGEVREVLDRRICEVDRWRDGVIAERIACVDGLWQMVGQVRLYDRAPDELTAPDGPGAIHPEDADDAPYWEDVGFYLRLMRDVMGEDGRYSSSLELLMPDGSLPDTSFVA